MKNNIGYIDRTVNVCTGCAPDFPCWERCWAKKFAYRLWSNPRLSDEARDKYSAFRPAFWPERLPQLARGKGKWIAVNFMGDMFCEGTPDFWQADTLIKCSNAPWNTFLFLTKRPENILPWFMYDGFGVHLFQNCLFGTSISTQADAETRIPELLKLEGLKLWVSVEPMLEHIELRPSWLKKLSWVVCGKGNWKGAPWQREWWNVLEDDCQLYKIPFWLKGKNVDSNCQHKPEMK